MAGKIACSKKAMKNWRKQYKDNLQSTLKEIELRIKDIILHHESNFSEDDVSFLCELEAHCHSILEKEKTTWCLKSHALWQKEGNNNTKLFHHYANFSKNLNSIWEIKVDSVTMFIPLGT
jgi:hypothetical protein